MRRPFCLPSWFRQTKLVFEPEPEFDGSNPYIEFERNLIKNDCVRVTTTQYTSAN